MHLAEGIITGYAAAGYTAGGVALLGWGTWRMKKFAVKLPDKKALLGMGGALIFFVSLIPLPAFTGTCTHPCGVPLVAILLGPGIATALAGISLFLQAAFFAHGGFSTWGANVLALGLAGSLSAWLIFRGARWLGAPLWLAGGAAGLIGDLTVYATAGLILAAMLAHAPSPQFTFGGYLSAVYLAYLPTQAPIAVGEMLITGLALQYAFKQRPEVLADLGVVRRGPAKMAGGTAVLLAVLLGLTLVVSSMATALAGEPETTPATVATAKMADATDAGGYVGMDDAINERLSKEAGIEPREPFINLEQQGDLWNTVLLFGGGACGFILGRWWHLLFGRDTARQNTQQQEQQPELV